MSHNYWPGQPRFSGSCDIDAGVSVQMEREGDRMGQPWDNVENKVTLTADTTGSL